VVLPAAFLNVALPDIVTPDYFSCKLLLPPHVMVLLLLPMYA
jgi:hypothetical protein